MIRKLQLCGFLIAAFLIGVSGCGKAETAVEETATENQEEALQNQSGDVNLVLWGAEEDQELLAKMAEEFKQAHAGEANINIEIGAVSESDAKNTVLADVEGSADVFSFADDQLRALVAAGALSPVEKCRHS